MNAKLTLAKCRSLFSARHALPRRIWCQAQISRSLTVLATTEEATLLLAEILSSQIVAGDCYCLYGNVGAGKSTFSRSFVRCVANDPTFPVPSPTFLLKNMYEFAGQVPIHHYDLYRLESMRGRGRLEMEDSLTNAVSLIEWAERLPEPFSHRHLKLSFTIVPPGEQEQRMHRAHREALLANAQPDVNGPPGYDDHRWRQIELKAFDEHWAGRLLQVERLVEQIAPDDLLLLDHVGPQV